jgi:predicted Zn-dependent peptidase
VGVLSHNSWENEVRPLVRRPAILLFTLLLLITQSVSNGLPGLKVSRKVLANGLTILALEDHTLPNIAFYTLYRVGSRNERPGITGLSHLFEHMMFNGSAKFKPGQFDQIIEAGGGESNAFTTADTTEYFEEFSPHVLDQVLQLEADRIRALKLDKANIEQERGIVKEERRVNTDESLEASMVELLWNQAYMAHPYHWDTIGYMKDLDAIRLQDAKQYFKTYYAPNNAVVVVAGDFNTKDLFTRMVYYFGDIPRQPKPDRVVNSEPAQQGERRALLKRPAELPSVVLGYKGLAIKSKLNPALDILAIIMGGGESSRLYQSLVYDQKIAASVSATNDARLHPGLMQVYAQAQPGHTTTECEAAIAEVIQRVTSEPPTQKEIDKAVNLLETHFVHRFETNLGRAGMLAEYEAKWGDWRELYQYLPRLKKVTPQIVLQTARSIFKDNSKTVVTLQPTQAGNGK